MLIQFSRNKQLKVIGNIMSNKSLFKFVRTTANKKTGPIAVSYTSSNTCPDTCALKGSGCYAELGPVALQWKRVGSTVDDFFEDVQTLRKGSVMRHNVAGDLPHDNGSIDKDFVKQFSDIAKRKKLRVFTYTHHLPHINDNQDIIADAINKNFVVNLSADNINQAIDYYNNYKLPVVSVGYPELWEKGNRIKRDNISLIRCPAEYTDTKCIDCMACAKHDRKSVIVFTAHGSRKKKASIIAKG